MQFIVYLIVFIVGVVIYNAVNPDPLDPARDLEKKFKEVGDMSGMNMEQIIKKVGSPHSRSQMVDGLLLQWIVPGYHIAIIFDEHGYFKTINHESYTA